MKYALPSEAREFVLFQRTRLLPKKKRNFLVRALSRWRKIDDNYEDFVRRYAVKEPELIDKNYFSVMQDTANKLLPFIPSTTSSILDVGCGIAGLDLFFYEKLNSPKLYLLDKTAVEQKVWYDFEREGAFYNSLELARQMLLLNGVSEELIECIDAPDDGVIEIPDRSIDLVVSTISWGFHYPVSTYVKSVAQILSKKGVLIIDIRKGVGGEDELEKFFNIEVVGESHKYKTVRGRVNEN